MTISIYMRFAILFFKENEIRVAFDIISNLSMVQQESLSRIRQKKFGDVDASFESTNILAQSREVNNTFPITHQELIEKQQFRSALLNIMETSSSAKTVGMADATRISRKLRNAQNSNSLFQLEVETVRGPISSPPTSSRQKLVWYHSSFKQKRYLYFFH